MYEEQSFEVIMQRMLDRVPEDIDKREGSIIWDALSPEALEFARLYVELNNVLNLVFARTTYGTYLDLICESHGVERNEAEYATGYAWVEGSPSFINYSPVEISVVVKGTVLKYSVVDENNNLIDLLIPQEGKIKVKLLSQTPGAIGNIEPNTIELYEYLPGVDKIYNLEAFNGGVNEEADSSLLQRLLEKVKNPPSSGNINDYVRWAKEISGAESVKVIPLWNGPGTVKLIVYGANGMPVTQEIINNVKTHIDPMNSTGEGRAPVGATVTVVTINIKHIDIEISGLIKRAEYTLESVQNSIRSNLETYLKSVLPGDTVIFKSIEAIVMNTTGVLDFNSLKINGQSVNLITNDEEKVLLSEVRYIE